jgi:hypothetical protein
MAHVARRALPRIERLTPLPGTSANVTVRACKIGPHFLTVWKDVDQG